MCSIRTPHDLPQIFLNASSTPEAASATLSARTLRSGLYRSGVCPLAGFTYTRSSARSRGTLRTSRSTRSPCGSMTASPRPLRMSWSASVSRASTSRSPCARSRRGEGNGRRALRRRHDAAVADSSRPKNVIASVGSMPRKLHSDRRTRMTRRRAARARSRVVRESDPCLTMRCRILFLSIERRSDMDYQHLPNITLLSRLVGPRAAKRLYRGLLAPLFV